MDKYFKAWRYICKTCGIDDKLFEISHIPCEQLTEEQFELNRNVATVTDAIILLDRYIGYYSKGQFKVNEQVEHQGNIYTIKQVIELKQNSPLQRSMIYAYVIENEQGLSIAYERELKKVVNDNA